MKKSRFTDEQIAFALRQAESGVAPASICRKLDINEQTFYRWKKKFAGLGVAQLRRLKQMRSGDMSSVMLPRCRGMIAGTATMG